MKCLFVFQNHPPSFSYSGAASRTAMDFASLAALGLELHVVRFLSNTARPDVAAHESARTGETADIRARAASWVDVDYTGTRRTHRLVARVVRSVRDPAAAAEPEVVRLAGVVRERFGALAPELVWSVGPLSGWIVGRAGPTVPWSATLTDWRFRLVRLRDRGAGWKGRAVTRWTSWTLRRADVDFLGASTTAVTGSTLQAEDMRAFGARAVHVIPQGYPDELGETDPSPPPGPPRIVHFGSLETTSNWLGMEAYLDRAHPALRGRLDAAGAEAPLWVVGDLRRARPEVRRKLEAAGALCPGFVQDLGEAMRPFDVSIIPYEFPTGLRSKVPLLFSRAQAVVATEAAVGGMPELQGGDNCVLVRSVDEFPDAVGGLIERPDERVRLGRAARATFEREFRLESQRERYRAVLEGLGVAPPVAAATDG